MPHPSDKLDSYLLTEKAGQLERARSWSPRTVDTLAALVSAGEERELFRINPMAYAKKTGLTPGDAVDLFLHATRLGLFEMDWQVVCEGCGGITTSLKRLEHVHSDYDCPACTHHGDTTLDDVIRVTFTVAPQVRRLVFHDPDGLAGRAQEEYMSSFVLGLPDGTDEFYNTFLSGKRLLTTQTFRNLFRSELVSANEEIGVRDITIMFTDLKGSTEMYDRIGDPNAFNLVRQHFETLRTAVVKFEGATIKTIGDAVMATFLQPVDAVSAALEMLGGIDELNGRISHRLSLKIGIHRGQSIAVTLDERQDYFGQTVNIASRVQGLAGPDEICITQAMADSPQVKALMAEKFTVAEDEAALKGISERVRYYRLVRK